MARTRLYICLWTLLVCIPCPTRAVGKDNAEDTWDAVFMGADKVGYIHTRIEPTREDGKNLIHVRMETVMKIKRFNDEVEMKLEYDSVETADGKVLRMENRGLDSRTTGVVKGNAMTVTLETPGKKSNLSIPWGDDVLGPAAEDRILKTKPLQPGQKFSFRSFMPDLNQVVTNVYTAEELDDVKMFDESTRRLMRVQAQIVGIPALKNFKTTMWVDDKGETQKTTTTMLAGMSTYRVTQAVALAPAAAFSADFGEKTLIRIDKSIPNAFDAEEIVYRITLKDENPDEIFVQDERQSLAKDENGAWLLTIRAIDPTQPPKVPIVLESTEFLRSNNYLQIEDPKVIAEARQAVGNTADPLDKSRRIEKWVSEHLTKKNFSKVFDSAAVVAERLEGDCTEHAVLLAAMARVAGVPSRVAVGLVYAQRLGAFGYHMWSEVFIGGRWIPLDGTLGLGHASPAHIKLADSSLDGVDAMIAFLPVARVMDRLKIEVVSVKQAGGR